MGEHNEFYWFVEWREADGVHSVDIRDLNPDQLVILARGADEDVRALIRELHGPRE